VVLKESRKDNIADVFSHETNDIHRVLYLDENGIYTIDIYDENETIIETIQPIFGGSTLDYIPFVPCESDCIRFTDGRAPLNDMADTNIKHYQLSADLGASLHMFGRITTVARVPQQYVEDFRKVKMEFGSTKSIVLPTSKDADSSIDYLQPDKEPTMIVKEMERLEARMAAQGARMLEPNKRGVESADAMRLDMIGEISIASQISHNVSRALTICLEWMRIADPTNIQEDATITLNTDFLTTTIQPQMITALGQLVLQGLLTPEQLADALSRGEIIDNTKGGEADTSQITVQPISPTANVSEEETNGEE